MPNVPALDGDDEVVDCLVWDVAGVDWHCIICSYLLID